MPEKGKLTKRSHFDISTRIKVIDEVMRQNKSVYEISRRYNISPTIIHRWKKRYLTAGTSRIKSKLSFLGKISLERQFDEYKALEALEDKKRVIDRYPGQVSYAHERLILNKVVQNPTLSVVKLVAVLPQIEGRPLVGHHGVQNVLRRHNLNTVYKRQLYSQKQTVGLMKFIMPVVNQVRSVWEKFTPQKAPAPPPSQLSFRLTVPPSEEYYGAEVGLLS